MPVQTTYPGVYVQEVPSGVRTIVGVSTSVTAFVGSARQGPVNRPVRVFSVAEYVRTFGAPVGEAEPMGHAVAHFFANGGTQAIVVRVVGAAATAASASMPATGTPNLVLTAQGPGKWANRVGAVGLEATVSYTDTANPADLFTLVIRQRSADPRTGSSVVVAEERFENLSMAPDHPRYARKVLATSNLVTVSTILATATAVGTSTGKPLPTNGNVVPTGRQVLRVSLDHGPATDVVVAETATSPMTRTAIATAIDNALQAAGLDAKAETAGGANAPIVITSPRTGPGSERRAVTVTVAPSGDLSQALGLGRAWGGAEVSGAAGLRPPIPASPAPPTYGFTGGTDAVPGPAEVVPGSGIGGLFSLGSLEFPRFNILCLPDVPAGHPDANPATDPQAAARTQALTNALAYCKKERAFLVVDAPRNWPVNDTKLGGLPALGEHGAFYYPRVKVAESGPGGLPVTLDLPASGAVAGVMARTDAARGIWKAPAGLDAGIVGISGLTVDTTDDLSGQYNPRGINVLRAFPGAGTVIWGSRTLKGDDTAASEHKYVPVRRLTDYIASSLYLGTRFAVFEPNDPDLWGQLRLAVGTFMRGLYRQGAFQESPTRSESDSFFVVCDETVNPQSEIDLGRVNVLVGFAPLKPAEFVIVTITQISKLEG